VERGRSGRTIMRPRADRSAHRRAEFPPAPSADPRRPSCRPRRLSYAVAVANSPIDKSAAHVRAYPPTCKCNSKVPHYEIGDYRRLCSQKNRFIPRQWNCDWDFQAARVRAGKNKL
jgi:hypothetical protein